MLFVHLPGRWGQAEMLLRPCHPRVPHPGGPSLVPSAGCGAPTPWARVPGRALPEDTLARLPAWWSRREGRNQAFVMEHSRPGCVCEHAQLRLLRRQDVSTGSCDGDRPTGRARDSEERVFYTHR